MEPVPKILIEKNLATQFIILNTKFDLLCNWIIRSQPNGDELKDLVQAFNLKHIEASLKRTVRTGNDISVLSGSSSSITRQRNINFNNSKKCRKVTKPYKCNICRKKFGQKGNMKTHRCIHSRDKQYECIFCNKRFTQFELLNFHLYIHTGEKPFGCLSCDKYFTSKYQMRKHLTESHP